MKFSEKPYLPFSTPSQRIHSANSRRYTILLLIWRASSDSTTIEELGSMSDRLKHLERTPSPETQANLLKKVSHPPKSAPESGGMPKVVIAGDIRLRVTESYAAGRPVKGYYRLETEGMQEPLQVIWIIEGTVLNHTVRSIDVEFDVRGIPAGETLTRVLTAQVTDKNGQGCIVHSSIFIQIFVVRGDLRKSDLLLNTISL